MKRELKPGDRVKIKVLQGEYSGVVMNRPELADNSHVTLKLDNGYDIGIQKKTIQAIEPLIGIRIDEDPTDMKPHKDPKKPKVSILATGGTIASRIDYQTGGVRSAFTAEELISAVPEINEIACVSGRQVFNKFSENIQPQDWVKLAEEVFKEIQKGMRGIVVTHGTDTMGYTAAALSFMIKSSIPVVLTGAQRSSDRGSSDAASNLVNSVFFASEADYGGVCVLMHEGCGDDSFFVHDGTRVRKMHSSRRDAFKSINSVPLARVKDFKIDYLRAFWKSRGGEVKLDTRLEEKVALVKYYPGMSSGIIDYLAEKGCRGIVLEGTGLGHVSESVFNAIRSAQDAGVVFAMATQTIYGGINMNVYSTGRMLIKMGVVPCAGMLPETAYVKLCCVLGRTNELEHVKSLMSSNLIGELSL